MPNTPADLETAVKEAVLAVLPEIVKLVSAELDRRRGSGSGGGGGGGGGQKPNIAEQGRRVGEALNPPFKAF